MVYSRSSRGVLPIGIPDVLYWLLRLALGFSHTLMTTGLTRIRDALFIFGTHFVPALVCCGRFEDCAFDVFLLVCTFAECDNCISIARGKR